MHKIETEIGEGKLGWRRGAVDILMDILVVASKEASKTDIVYKTNLNFSVVKKYLDFLLRKGLIEANGVRRDRKSYQTTDKGRLFIKLYREAVELIL